MKRSISLLARTAMTLFLAVLGSIGAWGASDVITIGEDGYGYDFLPAFSNYNYAMSQQIFTKSEINHAAGNVTAIGFHVKNGPSTRNYTIYMAKTSKEKFGSESDWVTVSASDFVFRGDISFEKESWKTIDLDKVFEYDGNSNIAITVVDNSGSSDSWGGLSFYLMKQSPSEKQSIFDYNSEKQYDAANPVWKDATCNMYKNTIQLTFETCPKPSLLTISDVTDLTAQVSWTARGGESVWNLRYKETGAETWTNVADISDRSYTLTGLTSGKKYEVQVQSKKSDSETSDWTASTPFTTMSCDVANSTKILYTFTDRDGDGWGKQTIRIKEHDTGLELAYLTMPKGKKLEGTLTLCCGKEYDIEWIRDDDDYAGYAQCAFTFSYANSDKIFGMTLEDYEELRESHVLNSFVSNCEEYDLLMPTELNVYDENYKGATLAWNSKDAKLWQVSVSSDPKTGFEDGQLFLTGSNPFKLTGLEADKIYYTAVRSVETKEGSNGETEIIGKSRPTNPVELTTTSTNETLDPLNVTVESSTKAKVELLPTKGTEKRYNLLYTKLSDKRTAVDMNEVEVVKLEENEKAYLKKGKNYVYSIGPKKETFDNIIFIPAKSFEQVALEMIQGKSGAQPEPYSIGWVSKSELGDKPSLVSFLKLKSLLKKKYKISKKTQKKLYKEYKKKGFISKSTLKRLKKKRTRGTEDEEEGYLWIRHNESSGGEMFISDIEIISQDDQDPWYEIALNEGEMAYTFNDLTPETTYMVMVESVYADGTTGELSPITVFTTFSEIADPLTGVFSVGNDKKVNFAKGNLQYWMDSNWDAHWSFADHQYDVLGTENLEEKDEYDNIYPADKIDLFCWSAGNSNKGTVYTYPDDSYYTGDFEEWGTQTAFTDIYGFGWSTMTKDEWTYLLSERENAATLKSFATVNGVKGLVLLPDEWNAPDGVIISEEMTAEQWATIEKTGAVFLPAAGTLTVNMDSKTVATVNDVNVVGSYWSSTPSETDVNAFSMTFTESEVKPAVDIYRRIGSAVRLVKEFNNETDLSNIFADGCSWATFVAEESLTTPDGLHAYVVSETTATQVTATPIDFIPGGVAVLLNRTEVNASEYKAKPYTSGGELPASLLVGSATETTGLTPFQDFVLFNDEFVLSSAATVSASHAYLSATKVPAGARNMIIVIGGDATGIKPIMHVSVEDDTWYTIDGRRLSRKPAAKGLYIHHDKKFVIK